MVKRILLSLVGSEPEIPSATGSQPQVVEQPLQLGRDVGDLPSYLLLMIYQSPLRRARTLQSVYLSRQVPRYLDGSLVTVSEPVGGVDRSDEFLLSESGTVTLT